ncbi:MAG: hypothetical protein JO276_03865 [Sphingomonadaceae bacterium]|nr:hypothetical protein [Sphingomonadaceae bacterium]
MPSDSDRDDLLNWDDKNRFQKLFTAQAVRSYLFLSLGMGVIAFSLPIMLVAVGGYDGNYSISFFYHHVGDLCRNILVGSLCATGAFLFLFHGLSKTENWILNLAGIAAVSIALNPMGEQCPTHPVGGIGIHAASAILFFTCLAVVAVFFAKGRIHHIKDRTIRRRFVIAYNAAGFAMIAMPVAIFIGHWLGNRGCENHWIFWIECAGIWAFSFFWFVKTYEYRYVLGVK